MDTRRLRPDWKIAREYAHDAGLEAARAWMSAPFIDARGAKFWKPEEAPNPGTDDISSKAHLEGAPWPSAVFCFDSHPDALMAEHRKVLLDWYYDGAYSGEHSQTVLVRFTDRKLFAKMSGVELSMVLADPANLMPEPGELDDPEMAESIRRNMTEADFTVEVYLEAPAKSEWVWAFTLSLRPGDGVKEDAGTYVVTGANNGPTDEALYEGLGFAKCQESNVDSHYLARLVLLLRHLKACPEHFVSKTPVPREVKNPAKARKTARLFPWLREDVPSLVLLEPHTRYESHASKPLGMHATPLPHHRRGHWVFLKAERYSPEKRNTRVWRRPAWVGDREWIHLGSVYRVLDETEYPHG